jgi:hypothetical protein
VIANPDSDIKDARENGKRSAGSGNFVLFPSLRQRREQDLEPTCPFGHGLAIPTLSDYLRAQNKRNARQIVSYASRYFPVLQKGDASYILAIKSPAARHHAMEALSNLSKHLGYYQRWRDIYSRYCIVA